MATFLPFPLAGLFGMTDEQSMARVQSEDDEAAFARLVKRWEEPVRRLCSRMTGDEHLGQDLAQEVFTRIYLHRQSYRLGNRFSTWLWRIAMNLCHDELRRRHRRPAEAAGSLEELEPLMKDVAREGETIPDQAAEGRERLCMVRDALQRLPDPFRAVVVLRHYEDLKFREIAEVLGIPEGTVKSRMAEAMNRLGELLRLEPRPAAQAHHAAVNPHSILSL